MDFALQQAKCAGFCHSNLSMVSRRFTTQSPAPIVLHAAGCSCGRLLRCHCGLLHCRDHHMAKQHCRDLVQHRSNAVIVFSHVRSRVRQLQEASCQVMELNPSRQYAKDVCTVHTQCVLRR